MQLDVKVDVTDKNLTLMYCIYVRSFQLSTTSLL